MTACTADVLAGLNLLSWGTLAYGRQRGWVTASDLSSFAAARIAADFDVSELPAAAELTSAERLSDVEVEYLLQQLSDLQPGRAANWPDSWRLAKMVELQSQDLSWDDKVARLEELAAEFGFPADMRGCSRYSAGATDPLDEMAVVIANIKNQLGID
jgi:hypothetical protein